MGGVSSAGRLDWPNPRVPLLSRLVAYSLACKLLSSRPSGCFLESCRAGFLDEVRGQPGLSLCVDPIQIELLRGRTFEKNGKNQKRNFRREVRAVAIIHM